MTGWGHFHPWRRIASDCCLSPDSFRARRVPMTVESGRVEMWRGGCRSNISVAAPFVWRCLSGSTLTSFPHPAHRTGQADLPHPALGQNFTPSPTARRAQAGTDVRVLLSYKLRRPRCTAALPQHGQRGKRVTIAAMSLLRMVAIEFGMCRSGRKGGSSGSITVGYGKLREQPGGTRS
jgi:hypothetical protein